MLLKIVRNLCENHDHVLLGNNSHMWLSSINRVHEIAVRQGSYGHRKPNIWETLPISFVFSAKHFEGSQTPSHPSGASGFIWD